MLYIYIFTAPKKDLIELIIDKLKKYVRKKYDLQVNTPGQITNNDNTGRILTDIAGYEVVK